MDYFSWHYSVGVQFYIQRYLFTLTWISHYFSLSLLLKTLFAPWKRLIDTDKKPGFNPARWFERFTFNIISRFIGAVTRLTLFVTGVLALFFVTTLGAIGLFVWVVIPYFSWPLFSMYQKSPESLTRELIFKIRTNQKHILDILFDNIAGEFVLVHLHVDKKDMIENADTTKVDPSRLVGSSYKELLGIFVSGGVWTDEFLRNKGLTREDILLVASWWDQKKREETDLRENPYLGRSGIGLELLFGYTPLLNQLTVDLGAPQSFAHHLIGREHIISRIERALSGGMSVVITGQPGVGKKTVILGFARRAAEGEFGTELAYRRVLELDYNLLFAQASDINQKKTKLASILAEASSAGNIILVIKDIHRITNSQFEGFDFTDIFEKYLEKRDLKIIAISSNTDYERFIAPNNRLKKFLETVEVTEPTKNEAFEILAEAADRWESKRGFLTTIQALKKILEGSDRYISETPFPEKALELLDAVVMYKEKQNQNTTITIEDVNTVLSEKTGISFARLTESEKKRLGNIEEIIHERLVNQETAVELIGKILRSKATGVAETNRPLGSFLFLGPTGVGKTETAKVLSKVYYGEHSPILRFDMAEYAGEEGLPRLIGSQVTNQPGVLTTAIKNRPASLLLLDEIEKAPPQISNLFLSLLDEGVITDAFGRKINCQHLFVIATSNAGSEYIRQAVTQGTDREDLQNSVVNHVLEQGIFSPEFINRFDGVVVYEPLKPEHLELVARLLLDELAKNMQRKSIYLEFSPAAVTKLAREGYEPAFGARPMRRIIEVNLGDLIGKALLADEIKEGDSLKIEPAEGSKLFRLTKTS